MSILLQPLAQGFRLGIAFRAAAYRYGWFEAKRLARPVVSVGNLTLGGSGKTPLVALIAEALLRRGRKPGILARGYGRRSTELVAIAPGAGRKPDPRETGDEPALLAQALPQVPIVVCADRYRAGRLAEEQFGVDVHVLDDGFQHWALARDVDLAAVDVTQEFSDRDLLPAGRQREPCSALARAHIVILTRTELSEPGTLTQLETHVQGINPQARIFRSTMKLCRLCDLASGPMEPMPFLGGSGGKPVAAFCGIGNSGAFFAGLRHWGFHVAGERAYRDHHVYSAKDLAFLQKLAARSGASALVTTEKDAINVDSAFLRDDGVPLYACVVRVQLSQAEAFEETLLERLGSR